MLVYQRVNMDKSQFLMVKSPEKNHAGYMGYDTANLSLIKWIIIYHNNHIKP